MFMFAACSSDDEISDSLNSGSEKEITIRVEMPEDNDTRVAVDGLSVTWQEGDQLIALGSTAEGQKPFGETVFTLVSGAGTKYATFKGMTIDNATSYQLVYKVPNMSVDEKTGMYFPDCDDYIQNGVNSQEHFKDALSLISAPTPLKGEDNISLNHASSFLRLDVRSLPSDLGNVKKVMWFINYAGEGDELVGSLNFDGEINNLTAEDDHNYLYLPFVCDNQKLNANSKIAVRFVGNTCRTVNAVSMNGKQYEIGKRYDIRVSTDENDNKSLHTWDVVSSDRPADYEMWVKTADGAAPVMKSVKDAEGNVYTLSDNVNDAGWYVYGNYGVSVMKKTPIMEKAHDITNVLLSDAVKEISARSFWECSSLAEVNMPSELTTVADSAFLETAITKIDLPNSVTSIGKFSFSSSSLREFNVNKESALKYMAPYCLSSARLDYLVVPKNVIPCTSFLYGLKLFKGLKIFVHYSPELFPEDLSVGVMYTDLTPVLYLHESHEGHNYEDNYTPQWGVSANTYVWLDTNAWNVIKFINDDGDVVKSLR